MTVHRLGIPAFKQQTDAFMKGYEALAIIPARGGSKGIPRKNLADLCGRPLLAYSIEAARRSAWITRVVVSTDDPEIAEAARRHGAEAPFLRPREISGDKAAIGDVVRHVLDTLRLREGYRPDCHCLLFPTSPFRSPELVDELVRMVARGYRSAITVKRIDVTRQAYFAVDEDGRPTRVLENRLLSPGRTLPAYRPYGVCSAHNNSPHHNGREYHLEITDPTALVDIDSPGDLELARRVIENNLFRCPPCTSSCP